MKQNRKDFLKGLGLVTIGACCGTPLLFFTGCSNIRSVQGSIKNNMLSVDKSEMNDGNGAIVLNNNLKAPIYLKKIAEEKYSAVLMLCTHKACELNPVGTILQCPCHGSEFSQEGTLLEGPAETDLLKYRVTSQEDKILIHL